ncbi:transposase family protein [Chroococcidiopsis sp. FACHB-1243]|uniref:transposase family protein n=1 Tax=Chroococcidiopsis sp. [FACHB-1243] TaxID=2692781 RepID=UPI00178165A9|nr:transposase family protein [Chroococcidiopsis sp. [FACHB-1243]]
MNIVNYLRLFQAFGDLWQDRDIYLEEINQVLEFLQHLLPDPTHLQLDTWDLDFATRHLSLTVSSTQISVPCPVCQGLTQRVHGRYERTLQELPCVNYSMSLLLLVRKFFCINAGCNRRIFTERLPTVTAPWARRTIG